MGTQRPSQPPPISGLGDALFSPVQQRVLGLVFGQPDRRFQSAELIRLVSSGTGAVHRQLRRLADAGLVEVTEEGNQKFYRARKDTLIFAELHGLAIKTAGVLDPLREALAPFEERIVAAFVFGSLAKGDDRADSDVDLLVVSDEVHYADLFPALEAAEKLLARPVNPTILTPEEWRHRREQPGSFAARIVEQPRLFVIGSEDGLS